MKDYYCAAKNILLTEAAYECCDLCCYTNEDEMWKTCKTHKLIHSGTTMKFLVQEYKNKLRLKKLYRIL
jgi:hypothetical protein